VDTDRRVITVRVEDGKPVRDENGRILVAAIQCRSASGQWVPYTWNSATGDYRCVRDPRGVPPWYDRFPEALASRTGATT
jgi:hypothetical protein